MNYEDDSMLGAANSSFIIHNSSLILVFEMTNSCGHHRDAMFVAIVERKLILDGTTRLNNCGHTFISGNLHAVGEGEESVRCHHGTFQVEAEVLGFFDGLLQSIHT
mgnify:FL=1